MTSYTSYYTTYYYLTDLCVNETVVLTRTFLVMDFIISCLQNIVVLLYLRCQESVDTLGLPADFFNVAYQAAAMVGSYKVFSSTANAKLISSYRPTEL